MKALILLSLTLSSSIFAGTIHWSEVDEIYVGRDGRGYVIFVKEIETPADCKHPTGWNRIMTFDTNMKGGESIYSQLLTAKASNRTIFARGTGLCSDFPGNGESINYVKIR